MRRTPSLRLSAVGALLASAAFVSASLTAAAPVAAAQTFGTGSAPWAGYVATGQTYTSITGSWTEPPVTCGSTADFLYAPWVGLDGFNPSTDGTVEQTGVQTSCKDGVVTVSGWFEIFPASAHFFSDPASIGDQFTATVTYVGHQTYTMTLTDNTKGWTETVTKNNSKGQNVSAEAVMEAPVGTPVIPGGVTFTGVTVDGALLSTFNPTPVTVNGWTPSTISDGDTFTVTHP